MTQAEYARYRGVRTSTVASWKRRGLLVMTRDGKKVDVKRSDARLEKGRNPVRAEARSRARVSDGMAAPLEYSRAKAQEAHLRAVRLRLEVERMAAQLIPRDRIEPMLTTAATMAREALLSIPDRVAPLVAVESDDARCHAIVEREVRRALEEYCRMLEEAIDGDGGGRRH